MLTHDVKEVNMSKVCDLVVNGFFKRVLGKKVLFLNYKILNSKTCLLTIFLLFVLLLVHFFQS